MFLMELLIAILFFSVASAVCVQIFVKSHITTQNAAALNDAVINCESIADLSASTSSLEEAGTLIGELYPEADVADHTYLIAYDQNDAVVSTDDPEVSYMQIIRLSLSDPDASMLITDQYYLAADPSISAADFDPEAISDANLIYSLQTEHHFALHSGDIDRLIDRNSSLSADTNTNSNTNTNSEGRDS